MIRALINSGSKVNAIMPMYILKLGIKICPTNVGAQNINSSTFKIFGMVLASFQIKNKLNRACFF